MPNNLVIVIACLLIGVFFRLTRKLPEHAPSVLNALVLQLALPSLVLQAVHSMRIDQTLLLPALVPWLLFGLSLLFFETLGPYLGLSRTSRACLALTTGLGNTSFVGFPLIEALLGKEALPTAVVIDQLGSFLILSTWATVYAARASSPKAIAAKVQAADGARISESNPTPTPAAPIWRKVVFFPPFIALVVALATRSLAYPVAIEAALTRLGDMLTPLALVSVGFQLDVSREKLVAYRGRLTLGLFTKLGLQPLLIFALVSMWPGFPHERVATTVLEAGMASMITGAILAGESGFEPELAALMVGIGIPISLVTVPLWKWAMGF